MGLFNTILSKIFRKDGKKIKNHRLTKEINREFGKRLGVYWENQDYHKLKSLYHEMKRLYDTVSHAVYGPGSDYTFTEHWNLSTLEYYVEECDKYIHRLDE